MLAALISLFTFLHSVTGAPLRDWKGAQVTADPMIRSSSTVDDNILAFSPVILDADVFAAESSCDMMYSAATIDHSNVLSDGTYPQYFPLPSLAVPYPAHTPLRTGLDVEFRRRRSTSPNTSIPSFTPPSSNAPDTRTTPQVLRVGGSDEQPVEIVPRDGMEGGNRTVVEIAVATTKATAATSAVAAELGSATDSTSEPATPPDATSDGNAGDQLADDIQSFVQRILQTCVQILFDNAATVGFLIALCTVLYLCGLRLRWKAREKQDAV